MLSQTTTEFKLSLNKIVISAFIILIVGVGAGLYLPQLSGLRSKANMGGGCQSSAHDVDIYRDHLIGVLRGGGKITLLQMNTFLDLIDIRNSCMSDANLA